MQYIAERSKEYQILNVSNMLMYCFFAWLGCLTRGSLGGYSFHIIFVLFDDTYNEIRKGKRDICQGNFRESILKI